MRFGTKTSFKFEIVATRSAQSRGVPGIHYLPLDEEAVGEAQFRKTLRTSQACTVVSMTSQVKANTSDCWHPLAKGQRPADVIAFVGTMRLAAKRMLAANAALASWNSSLPAASGTRRTCSHRLVLITAHQPTEPSKLARVSITRISSGRSSSSPPHSLRHCHPEDAGLFHRVDDWLESAVAHVRFHRPAHESRDPSRALRGVHHSWSAR